MKSRKETNMNLSFGNDLKNISEVNFFDEKTEMKLVRLSLLDAHEFLFILSLQEKTSFRELIFSFSQTHFYIDELCLIRRKEINTPFIGEFLFEVVSFLAALSFNQPNFSSTPQWNSNAITFANQSIVGPEPLSIFINTNNTIYIPHGNKDEILVWHEGNTNPTKIISGNFSSPYSLFVTSNGDIYINDGFLNGRVQKWISQNNSWITVMNVNSACAGLFVDIHDDLYCSMWLHHQVVKRELSSSLITATIVAGTGTIGRDSNRLLTPYGIFVDVNLDLYVTDSGNDRVQLFQSGQLHGITVAGGSQSSSTISLNSPIGIVLDAQKYLFIVDSANHRIVGSSPNGWQCLVGCYGRGSQSNQLIEPSSLSFDRLGNLYVTDKKNHRIEKFELLVNAWGKLRIVE